VSILPLVDELVVAVGESADGTKSLVKGISPKIKVIDTVWDDSVREGGRVLALETNKALSALNPQCSWAIYIQGDECMHEAEHQLILEAMRKYEHDLKVEGFLFSYLHFYGSYDYVADGRSWYRKEVRIIRNDPEISSWKDAQGFRKNGRKLNVIEINARIHHYGWVRHPEYQMAKQREAHKLWYSDQELEQKFELDQVFDYSQIDSISRYEGSHPLCMNERIERMNWTFDRDPEIKSLSFKSRILHMIEAISGQKPFEHRNYKLIGKMKE
jgi:hypothetical protein